MKSSTMFIINLVLTCLTCIFILLSCGSCTEEQLTKAGVITSQMHDAAETMPPLVQSQPWYVFVLLASDIASSIAAAWLAFEKKKTAQ